MIYGLLFLITLTLSFFELSYFEKKTTKRVITLILLINCLFLLIISGLRFETGTDYLNYKKIFNEINSNLHRERLFVLINLEIKSIWNNFNFYLFIMAFISLTLKFISIKRYAVYPLTAFYIYFCTYFLRWDMGSIRVAIASGVLFLSLPYIKNRKFINFLFLVIIAFLFHRSAVIFLPMYFIANKEYSNKTILFLFVLVITFSYFGGIYGILIKVLEILPKGNFVYNKLYSYIFIQQTLASNLLTFSSLKKLVIIILSLMLRNRLREKYEYYNICLNLVLIGYLCYFLFITSLSTLALRIPSLFVGFEVFLFSSYLCYENSKFNKVMLYLLIITLSLSSYLMHLIKWKEYFIPYQII